jgi:hypothetical protein
MFKFNISTKEVSHFEISEWLAARDAVFTMIYTRDVNEWMNGQCYQLYDIEIADDLIAVEFRLAFGANIGESPYLSQYHAEQEIMAVLCADIAKEIDDEICKQLLATATTYLDTIKTAKLYGIDDDEDQAD